jgi:hypothetical protein
MQQDQEIQCSDDDLEIVELPQREALSRGGGGGQRGSIHHNTIGGSTSFFGIFIDLF